MARVFHEMQVTQIFDHTPLVRELVIEARKPESFQFKAGQFVMLHIPQTEKPALRAYSIASDDRKTHGFRLLFKYVENGIASQYVWQLKGSETLTFTGPFGRVFFQEPPTQQVIFLNTGTGVSQHLSYLLSKADLFPQIRYRMLFGVRSEQDIYLQDELEQLQNSLPDFQFEYILSKPSPNWTGRQGYVQNFINDFDFTRTDSTFYMCGNGNMIKDVKALLETHNFDKAHIFAEAFD